MLNKNQIGSIYCKTQGFHDCENNGCIDEGICRCYKIYNADIEEFNFYSMVSGIYNNIFKNDVQSNRDLSIDKITSGLNSVDINYIYRYLFNRILIINKIYLPKYWEIKIEMGYYGDELMEINLEDSILENINSQINTVLNIPLISQKIEFILKLEYGYVTDQISSKSPHIETIDRNSVIFPSPSQLNIVKSEDLSYLNGHSGEKIRGICIKQDDYYRVIDGYHRIYNEVGKFESIIYS